MESISVDQVFGSTGVDNIPCGGAAVFYTKHFKLDYADRFGVQYKATVTGAATILLKIELEQGNVAPTDCAADTNFVVPEGGATVVAALADELVHITTLAPVVAKYGRFKITGSGGNHASVALALKLAKAESHG